MNSAEGPRAIGPFALAFFGVILLRTAWLSDSVYVLMRSVEHLAHGDGLTWNAGWRVQAFEDPLWVFVLCAGRLVLNDLYSVTIGASVCLSLATAWIVLRRAPNDAAAVLVAAALALSPVFVTFSTSGLDDPLRHALAAVLAVVLLASWREGAVRAASLPLLAMAVLADWRMALLFAPAVGLLYRDARWTARVTAAAVTAAPLVAWIGWASWYYGTVGSNGTLADWHGGAVLSSRFASGVDYMIRTAAFDPLASSLLVAGAAAGVIAGGLQRRLGAGIVLYIFALVALGGSPMAGRGWTPALVVALVLVLMQPALKAPAIAGAIATAAILITFAGGERTFAADASYGDKYLPSGRAHDARAEDYQATGLLLESRGRRAPDHPETRRARTEAAAPDAPAAVSSKPGFFSAGADLGAAVVDDVGVLDPLLARLPPAIGSRWHWGWERRIPAGYLDALGGRSPARVAEPPLAELLTDLTAAMSGPLVDSGRFKALVALPHAAAALIDQSSYGPRTLDLTHDAPRNEDVLASKEPVREGGLILRLPSRRTIPHVDFAVSESFDVRFDSLDGASFGPSATSPRADWEGQDEGPRGIDLSSHAATALWFRCGRGVGACQLDYVRVR